MKAGSRKKPARSTSVLQQFYSNKKYVAAAAVAVVLIGGSFGFASGAIGTSGNALLAQVISAITGRPMLILSRDYASPSGSISMGTRDTLAIYDVSVSNVTHWATVNSVPLQINVNQAYASPLAFQAFTLQYTYCIPVNVTYGYGYRSGGCATTTLTPTTVSRSGTAYIATFYMGIPVYPQQTSGKLTVSAIPIYEYTGNATNQQGSNATFTVQVTGLSASGDQCVWSYGFLPQTRTYGFSYTGCVASQAIPNIVSAYGNTLAVPRPYGYGYNPYLTNPTPVPASNPPVVTPPAQSNGDDQATQLEIEQLRQLIVVLIQQLTQLLQAKSAGH